MADALSPAVTALLGGIVVGGVLLVPWVILRYRRRGSLGWGDATISFGAVVYGLGLITFTILPLPVRTADFCLVHQAPPQLQPFAFIGDVAREGRVTTNSGVLLNPALAQIALNVLFFIPLGMLVRHLFRRGVLTTTFIGLGVSLLIELTQLTGVWSLYPCAYRLFDVDDLIANILGTLLGASAAPLLKLVPGQRTIAPTRPRPITTSRRLLGMLVDGVSSLLILTVPSIIVSVAATVDGDIRRWTDHLTTALDYLPLIVHLLVIFATGRTIGEFAVRIRSAAPLTGFSRLLRWLLGIGGLLLLGQIPITAVLQGPYAIVLIVAAFTTRGHRGLAYVVLSTDVEDDRTLEFRERPASAITGSRPPSSRRNSMTSSTNGNKQSPRQTGDSTTVLIIGAGPTGLTLACELARADIPHRLIDATTGPQRGSRGKGLQPRTLEVFQDLGIVDRVLANGRLAMPIRSTAPDGMITAGGTVPGSLADRPDIPFPASVTTPQWRIEAALRVRLAELGSSVEFGTALASITQTPTGVSAVIARGDSTETITATWAVGCDGGHSLVRKNMGVDFEGDTLEDVRMIVADVTVDGLSTEAWETWRHEEGLVALCPLPSTDLFQYQASLAPGQDPELLLTNMQSILERRSGRTDIRLRSSEWSSLWRANIRLASRYRQGQVFLAGDAAHIHSPAGGQGMNTGIQDACNLAWKLAAVANGADTELLASYEAERRPVAASVLALSNERLRQTLEQSGMQTKRDTSTTQLGVEYRHSILATDDRPSGAALRAGDRAPDATGLSTVHGDHRLFDLISGGRFRILDFGLSSTASITPFEVATFHIVGQPTLSNEVADTQGFLARAYEATDQTLVLIRPDGYIALISDAGRESAITEYLTRIWRGEHIQTEAGSH